MNTKTTKEKGLVVKTKKSIWPGVTSPSAKLEIFPLKTKTTRRDDVIWICVDCAKRFGRKYVEGKTNISTSVRMFCEGCHCLKRCMHYRSYPK